MANPPKKHVPTGFYVLNRTQGTCAAKEIRSLRAAQLCGRIVSRQHYRDLFQVVEVYRVNGRLKTRVWGSLLGGKDIAKHP